MHRPRVSQRRRIVDSEIGNCMRGSGLSRLSSLDQGERITCRAVAERRRKVRDSSPAGTESHRDTLNKPSPPPLPYERRGDHTALPPPDDPTDTTASHSAKTDNQPILAYRERDLVRAPFMSAERASTRGGFVPALGTQPDNFQPARRLIPRELPGRW